MKLSRIWLFSLLPLVAACAGGGSASRAVPQSEIAPLGSQRAVAVDEADIRMEAATPVPVSTDLLYVANSGNNSVTVYHHDASGDTAPLKIIAGSKTGITSPGQLSEDAAGNLYVSNTSLANTSANILVFAHGANGNVQPIRNLRIPLTGAPEGDAHFAVDGMTVDRVTGKIFVAREVYGEYGGLLTLLRFAPDATGNEAPAAISAMFAEETPQIANDSTGQRIIVPHNVADGCECTFSGVDTVVKQFSSGANPYLNGLNLPCPLYNPGPPCYGPSFVAGVADDPTTKTYVVSTGANYGTSGIVRFSESATSYKPISTITSATNCSALALGYLRNIYAVCGTNTIDVYEHDASGNVPPLRVLSGKATKLDSPSGIYEGS
jgi:hypothetical protein